MQGRKIPCVGVGAPARARRQVYKGQLTVSQISGHEEELEWWDAVDVIGIDACALLARATPALLCASPSRIRMLPPPCLVSAWCRPESKQLAHFKSV